MRIYIFEGNPDMERMRRADKVFSQQEDGSYKCVKNRDGACDIQPTAQEKLQGSSTKKIRLKSESTGRVVEFNAAHVARPYAEHYATADSGTENQEDPIWIQTYAELFNDVLEDEFTLLDWAMNNMDWVDVGAEATLVLDTKIDDDFHSAWHCSDNFEVLDE